MKALYKVNIACGLSYEVIADYQSLKPGDKIIIECERFQELGTVEKQLSTQPIENVDDFEAQRAQQNKGRHVEGQKLMTCLRLATAEDFQKAQENDTRAQDAHRTAISRIRYHNLEMKLIQTHYSLDKKLLVFLFSADGRIDFRDLLRDLSGDFRIRVELRQIGVRDETALLGGLGTCGRPFCCGTFLHSFNSINVKMAKQQGLSLNPQNISGCCGRLRCCLQYESEYYSELFADQKAQTKKEKDKGENGNNDDEMTIVPSLHKSGSGNRDIASTSNSNNRHEKNSDGSGNAKPKLLPLISKPKPAAKSPSGNEPEDACASAPTAPEANAQFGKAGRNNHRRKHHHGHNGNGNGNNSAQNNGQASGK